MTIQLTIECDEDTRVPDEGIERIMFDAIDTNLVHVLERIGVEILWHKTKIHRDDDE